MLAMTESPEQLAHSDLTRQIIGAAMKVHSTLGPGFLESVYENALCRELRLQGIPHERQVTIPVHYEEEQVGVHRLDLLVNGKVIVELKACRGLEAAHFATVRAYMRAASLAVALLLNFGERSLTVKRISA